MRGQQLALDCDVLVYDSLVPPELVQRSRATTKLYVGKTRDGHAATQAEINASLVRLALEPPQGRTIVRLKGGDPLLFGRGGEEIAALLEAGIPFEVVPGVTAASAAAAHALVPLTDRRFSPGVILVTGHRRAESAEPLPWAHLVGCRMTLVFYMALGEIETIAQELVAHGMAPDTPALVAQEASLPGQRLVHERLDGIAARVEQAGIRPPAVLVVGRVAALFDEGLVTAQRPLAGTTALVLRPSERRYLELNRLRDVGVRILDPPLVESVPTFADSTLDELRREVSNADRLLFASALAVHVFDDWRRMHDWLPIVPPCWGVRESVRRELVRLGLPTAGDLKDERSLNERLERAAADGARRVWLLGREAADERIETIRACGLEPRVVHLYRQQRLPLPRDVLAALGEGRVDAVVFLSTATADAFRGVFERLPARVRQMLRFFAISASLAARVEAALGVSCRAPEQPGLDPLIALLEQDLDATRAGADGPG